MSSSPAPSDRDEDVAAEGHDAMTISLDVLNGPELRLILTALRELAELVDVQAEDEGLWFMAHTAAEAYQQQELRRLHAAVEATVNVAMEALR